MQRKKVSEEKTPQKTHDGDSSALSWVLRNMVVCKGKTKDIPLLCHDLFSQLSFFEVQYPVGDSLGEGPIVGHDDHAHAFFF